MWVEDKKAPQQTPHKNPQTNPQTKIANKDFTRSLLKQKSTFHKTTLATQKDNDEQDVATNAWETRPHSSALEGPPQVENNTQAPLTSANWGG